MNSPEPVKKPGNKAFPRQARPASANLAGQNPDPNPNTIPKKKRKKRGNSSIKFEKFKPYFQAYQLNPQAVFFVGSQIFLKNPKPSHAKLNLSRIFSKTPLKTTFKIPNNFFKSAPPKQPQFEKTTAQDIESLENKGILTWESQISEEQSEVDTSRNRAEFLHTLNKINLNRSEKNGSPGLPQHMRKMSQNTNHATPGGILRRKAEEKERERNNNNNTEISDKMLSFEINSVEKTPNNNTKGAFYKQQYANSPNKAKSKSISFSKQSAISPLKKRKPAADEQQRSARMIQKAVREFQARRSSLRSWRIIQHYPSYTLPLFLKKPQNLEKKPVNGSLLIIYYRRFANLRVVFKSLSFRRIFAHIFDFSELKDEKLRASLFDEFLNKVLSLLCLFGDGLVFKSWALSGQKSQKIKINKFLLEEIELAAVTESITKLLVPFFDNPEIKQEDLEPMFQGREEQQLSNSSQTSLHPLINGYQGQDDKDLGIFPLINQNGSFSDFSMIEPLITCAEESKEQTSKPDDTSRLEPILKDEGKRTSTNESSDLRPMQLMTQERIIDHIKRDSMISERRSSMFSESPAKSLREVALRKVDNSKRGVAARVIQTRFKSFLAYRNMEIRKMRTFEIVKRYIIRKSKDMQVDFRIYMQSSDKSLYVKAIFMRLENSKKTLWEERGEATARILQTILEFPQPLIWVKFDLRNLKVSLRDPQIFRDGLERFDTIFMKIPRKLMSCGFVSLFQNNRFGALLQNTLKFEVVFQKVLTTSIRKNFRIMTSWFHSQDPLMAGTRKVTRIFLSKKAKIWKQFCTKLRLIFELVSQLQNFCDSANRWIDKIETRRGYFKSFKKVLLFSKFKDCEFLDHRVLYYKKKAIEIFCYYHPVNEMLLIYTLSSEVEQYEEKMDFALESRRNIMSASSPIFKPKSSHKASQESLPKGRLVVSRSQTRGDYEKGSIISETIDEETKVAGRMSILHSRIKNITMIQDPNSIKLRFKLYPEEYLEAAVRLQSYMYKKLYSKTFEFKDFKSGKAANAYILMHGNRIHLVLKNKPALMSIIYEITPEMCYFLKLSQKLRVIEAFFSQGIFYSLEKNEILFKEPQIPKVWYKRTLIFDGSVKKTLQMDLDLKGHKLMFRIANEEKFYKIQLRPFDLEEETTLSEFKEIITKALDTTVILRESDGRFRILNDEDAYGPLMHKEDFSWFFSERKLSAKLRLIDYKKTFQVVIEVPMAYGMISQVTNAYIPYETEENKRLISEYLLKGFKENLNYDSFRGVILKSEFIKQELDNFLLRNKNTLDSPIKIRKKTEYEDIQAKAKIDQQNKGKPEGSYRKNETIPEEKSEILDDKILVLEDIGERDSPRKNERNQKEPEPVVLDGPLEEYEKVASLIQNAYRKKKSPLKKTKEEEKKIEKPKENIKNPSKNESQFAGKAKISEKTQVQPNIKPEPKKNEPEPVVLDGPLEEYEKVASLIQNAYRKKKSPLKKPKEEEKKKENIQSPLKNESQAGKVKISKKPQIQPNKPEPKKNEPEPVVLDGPLEEYEKVASLIQNAYRKKKSPVKKPKEDANKLENNTKNPMKSEAKIPEKPQVKPNIKPEQKRNEPEPVVLDGPLEEYEKVASLIQNSYRKKKSPLKKPKDKVEDKKSEKSEDNKKTGAQTIEIKTTEKPAAVLPNSKTIKQEPEPMVLDGPLEEYEKVASLIQNAYRKKKSPLKKTKEEEKNNNKNTVFKLDESQNNSRAKVEHPKNSAKIEEIQTKPKTSDPIRATPEPFEGLDGPLEEYEKVASLIQNAYRRKKSPGKIKENPSTKKESQTPKNVVDSNEKKIKSSEKPIEKPNPSKVIKYREKPYTTPIETKPHPKKPEPNEEEVKLEGDIADYEKAAVLIQNKYRKRKEKKEEVTSSPLTEDSPPKPLVTSDPDPKNPSPLVLEGDEREYESAALLIQAKYRKKHRVVTEQPKKPTKTIPEEVKSAENPSSHKSSMESRYSLPSKSIGTEGDIMEESDKILGLRNNGGEKRRNSFKHLKRNSLFSKFKGRTFELQKSSYRENSEGQEGDFENDENYRIRIFPAPEDLEIAVNYLQEWWRGVLRQRKNQKNQKDNDVENYLDDIGFLKDKGN